MYKHWPKDTNAKDIELVPEREDFGYQRSSRSEQADQGAPDQPAKITHRANYRPIRRRHSLFWGRPPSGRLDRRSGSLQGGALASRGARALAGDPAEGLFPRTARAPLDFPTNRLKTNAPG
jgi:hypothetical protein